jgi:hypothetical protein
MNVGFVLLKLDSFTPLSATKYSVSANKSSIAPSNPFLFQEFGLKVIKDYVPKADLAPIAADVKVADDEESDDSDEDDEREESEDFKREQQSQYEQLMEKLRQDGVG